MVAIAFSLVVQRATYFDVCLQTITLFDTPCQLRKFLVGNMWTHYAFICLVIQYIFHEKLHFDNHVDHW